ncbi:hypothetical protein MBANPS3_000292 [Mucor bainieri]
MQSFSQFIIESENHPSFSDVLYYYKPTNQQKFEADFTKFINSSLRKHHKAKASFEHFAFNNFECFRSIEADTYWKNNELQARIANINATQQQAYALNLEAVSEALLKRKDDAAPALQRPRKRTRTQVVRDGFVDSKVLSSNTSNASSSPSQPSSPSSYFPSDLEGVPVGHVCVLETTETDDLPAVPAAITDARLASLFQAAQEKIATNRLWPSETELRLAASAIFLADDDNDTEDEDEQHLPDTVKQNIAAYQNAVQRQCLYIPPHSSLNMQQMALNTIISSTFMLHGKERFRSTRSELDLVATSVATFLSPLFSAHDPIQADYDTVSWVFKQHDQTDDAALRPDILFTTHCNDKLIEIGCGEVKKAGAAFALKVEDKMRVLEIMKRQLHIRLKNAATESEAVTFGLVVCGTSATCYSMRMDRSRGACVYREDAKFVLPTTFETYSNMDTALEAMLRLKGRMLDSLPPAEADSSSGTIWHLYKPMIRPTVSSFEPLYRE